MIQLKDIYESYYYLTDDGRIYNADTKTYQSADNKHLFRLKTKENKYKKVSVRTLYKEIYNRPYCKDNIENIIGEEWKELSGTDGYYYVSNKGRIKSLQGYEAIILKPYTNKGGYSRVDIIEGGKRLSCLVHKLVAQSWLPMPERLDYQLHHKDFDKGNNAADNLIFLSPSEHLEIHRERNKKNVSSKPEENIH